MIPDHLASAISSFVFSQRPKLMYRFATILLATSTWMVGLGENLWGQIEDASNAAIRVAAQAPETLAPETLAPETLAPETQAPETQEPESQNPEAQNPESAVPRPVGSVDNEENEGGQSDESENNGGRESTERSPSITLGITPAGVQRHVPGRWATLAVNGSNSTSIDSEETLVVMLGEEADLQFARRLWIPAGARRQAWLPVQVPDESDPDQLQIDCRIIHLKESEQGEGYQANRIGLPTSTRSLLLSPEIDDQAALVLEPLDADPEEAVRARQLSAMIYAGYDASVTTRQDLGMTQLSSMFLPATPNPLDSLDEIVIASDRLLHDTVGLTRLQSWLQSGGRVWIMADQVSPESVRALVGDAMSYSIVDRVQLNEFEIEQLDAYFASAAAQESWSSETPVEMVRVLTDAEDVHSRIDGWPAAFWVPVGQGEMLVTTLGAEGWLRNESPTNTYRSLASRFFVKRLDPINHAEQLTSQLNQEIGYRIPGRGLIAALLGIHLLVLLVVGLWLARRKALHYLGVVLPASVLLAVGTLLWIGKQNTSAIPSTIATGQIVRTSSDTTPAQLEIVSAIYSQNLTPLPIRSSKDSITMLAEEASSGELRRILWDDDGQSTWQFLQQPPGKVQHARTQSSLNLAVPWEVKGRFTASGFEGQLQGLDAAECEDPVLVSAALPNMAITIDPQSGKVRCGPEQVLLPDQFFNQALISDRQRDRQALLRDLIEADGSLIPQQPSLLVWTRPIEGPVSFPDDFVRRGWTLGFCPIRLESLEPGTRFVLPAGFVRLESHIGTRGPSTVFNSETGRWLDGMDKPSEAELRCRLPQAVLPCDLRRCNVEMWVSAPGRTVEIKGRIDGEFETIHRIDNPAGRVSLAIDDPRVLSLDREGGFLISIAVSETQQERQRRNEPVPAEIPAETDGEEDVIGGTLDDTSRITWAIRYVHLHLEGTAK